MIDLMSSDPLTLDGACHCGGVRFTVTLSQGFASARRCSCSICRMRGAVTLTSTPQEFHVVEGGHLLKTYRFNTGVAQHHFCTVCGIYTHHKRRSNPNELGVNAACLENVSPFDFAIVPVHDGSRHPGDNPDHRTYLAGVLRFDPASDR